MDSDLYATPGHFYSPIPDQDDVSRHLAQLSQRDLRVLPGISIDDDLLLSTWEKLVPHMRRAPFKDRANREHRYHWQNNFYGYGDAAVYFAMLAEHRPQRVVEVGSGYSSALALDARELLNLDCQLTFIEPYPDLLETLLREGDANAVTIIRDKVQNVETSIFAALEPSDILFIDSSHVLKTGSDVCFELFDILPMLNPGVIVHIHDVFYPFEYPRTWLTEENRAWNELYAVRAFLMYNSAFRIIFFNDYFRQYFPERIASSGTVFGKNSGGGLWLTATGSRV